MDLSKKPKLVKDKTTKKEILKHSFSDIPDKAISLINFETITNDVTVRRISWVSFNIIMLSGCEFVFVCFPILDI